MKREWKAEALAYIRSHHVMILATTGRGGPWATAVFYVSRGPLLYFLSSPGSRHGKNLRDTPLTGIAINECPSHWRDVRGVQMEAEIGVVSEVREQAQVRALFRRHFPFLRKPRGQGGNSDLYRKFQIATAYRVRPRRVWFLDNRAGFAHRVAIRLDRPR